MGRIDIDGMTCAVCVTRVEKAIRSVAGIESISVNLAAGTANFSGQINIDEVIEAVNSSGYLATKPVNYFQRWTGEKEKSKKDFQIASIGLVFSLIAMFYIMEVNSDLAYGLSAMFIVVFLNISVLIKGIRSIVYGINMYTLILLAYLAAVSWSVLYSDQAMWEATFIVIAFVGFGDSIESIARNKATETFAQLSSLIGVGGIKIGDELSISAGQIIPVDGEIITGRTDIDQSSITGESLPVSMSVGDKVWAGSHVIDGSITIKASSDSGYSRIDQVIRLVESAQNDKARIEKTVDKIARIFVPVVILISVLTFFFWESELGTESSLMMAITVLVIACPCAMGLATPMSLFVGTTVGAQNGILLKGHRALESASKIETIVLDKTGTLTTGLFNIEVDNEEVLKIAASLERHTSHPIASAIVNSSNEYYEATDVVTIPGWGVKGVVNGVLHSVGKGVSGIEVKKEDEVIGIITVKDKVRSDAIEAIQYFPNVILSSGDSEEEVNRVAGLLGIEDARANQSPEDKLNLINSLSNVAMIGDGINDSAALAAANLGISVSSSSGIANISSDIVLTKDGVMTSVDALDLAVRTRSNIRQNLAWAFAYNTLAIPLAMGIFYPLNGFLLPAWAAAAAMSLSSMCVILNSIRLRWSFERSMIRRRHGSQSSP